MKTATRRTIGTFVGLLLLSEITGCDREEKRAVPPVIHVGALFPSSGDLKDKGVDSANGVKLAVEEINSRGGVASLGGARLELVFGDTRGSPDVGAAETERLITESNVVAVIGTYQSSVTALATQVAERLKTPFIVSISIADIITERGFRYTFRIQPKALFYARDQVQFLKELQALAGYPVKRVALLHENTAFGTSVAQAQRRALREQGLEVAIEVTYRAEGATNLHKEVGQALAANPDVILTVTYLMDSILIRKALKASGSIVPMVDMAGGTVSPGYTQMLGPLAEGTFTMAEYSKYAICGKDLNERFHARFGVDITGDSAYAYQAVLVLQDALERAGSLDRERLREALAGTDIGQGPQLVLPVDRLRFDANGQNEFAQLYVVQIQDGELVPVWPSQYATARVHAHW